MKEHSCSCPECKQRGEKIIWLEDYTDKLHSEIAYLKKLCEESSVKLGTG